MDLLFLKSFTDHMDEATQQLRDKIGPFPSDGLCFNLTTFKSNLCMFCKKLSNEVTKLSLIFSKDPLPTATEAKDLLHGIDTAYVDVLATFYTLPKDQGESMHNVVHKAVLDVLISVVAIIKTLSKTGVHGQKERLSLTGQSWEAFEAVEKLPENNLQSVCKIVGEIEDLVADALSEIVEEVKCSPNDPSDATSSMTWTNLDQIVLPPCIGLVKTTRLCLKKVNKALQHQGMCATKTQIVELDKVSVAVSSLSPSVDNLIASVYPPLDRKQVQLEASLVVTHTRNVLQMTKECHFVSGDDQVWIDFLLKALDHNNNKLQPLLLPVK